MLDEAGVDGHSVLFLGRHVGHSRPEACGLCSDFLAGIREIIFEWRVAHHEIKLSQALSVVALVVRGGEGVALYGVVERRDQTVEQEIEFEHLVGSLRDVL